MQQNNNNKTNAVKVSNSQKQNMVFSILPKTEQNSLSILSREDAQDNNSGAPYVVRPARPRSYLDFEK